MTYSSLNKTAPTNPPLFAGIDVGAEELVLVIRKDGKPFDPQKFANTPSGRSRLVKKLAKLPNLTVCLEATGVYHFDLAIALHDAGVPLMVVNPKASHHFAKVLMKNSKTDAVDANTLAEYAARMDFVAWTRPSGEKIALRSFARRTCAPEGIDALTRQKPFARPHRHLGNAQGRAQGCPPGHQPVGETHWPLVSGGDGLDRPGPRTHPGVHVADGHQGDCRNQRHRPDTHRAQVGELLLLPPGLSHREWVKFAGLDPKAFDSGKSVHKKARVSKAGNRHIRSALTMPALSAKQHDPH
ncbi:MAG: transposase, partial [Methylovulum miyakonense]|uniref:IS110 family transposase n=1 Tax=Methylovulum miyakonense TaxID=645578 RepID=UPI003BB735BD